MFHPTGLVQKRIVISHIHNYRPVLVWFQIAELRMQQNSGMQSVSLEIASLKATLQLAYCWSLIIGIIIMFLFIRGISCCQYLDNRKMLSHNAIVSFVPFLCNIYSATASQSIKLPQFSYSCTFPNFRASCIHRTAQYKLKTERRVQIYLGIHPVFDE